MNRRHEEDGLPVGAVIERGLQPEDAGFRTADEVAGNWGFRHWAQTPLGVQPATDSGWSVADRVRSGREWSPTRFASFRSVDRNTL